MEKRSMITRIAAVVLCLSLAIMGMAFAEEGTHLNASLYWFGTSLDPATDWDGWTTCRAGITETLVTVNENYEIVPLLADTWEQVDDTTWVMHIRDGVTFHNGKNVDAEACKKSIERVMSIQDRAVSGAKIASMEADGQNLTITTTEPFGAFLANLSEPMYSIIDVDAGTDFASAPVATGPFMVTGFEVDTEIDLAAYDGYWNGASQIDTVTVTMIDDDSTRSMALQGGQLDLIQRPAWTDIPTLEADENLNVYDTQGARTRILQMNQENAFLGDVNVRKAFAASIDYVSLVNVLGSGVSVAGAPYPASAPYGYDQLPVQSYDAAAATQYLTDAGYTDSDGNGYVDKDGAELAFTILYSNNSYTTMLEAVQDMAKQVGIHVELSQVESWTEQQENGNFDIICTDIQVLSTGDPQWYLEHFVSTSSSNYVHYNSEALDAKVEELTTTFDPDQRAAVTIEAEQILLDDCAAIWLVGENNFVAANSKVKNVTPYPIDYYLLNNTISVE